MTNPAQRTCPVCATALVQRPDEQLAVFRRRKTCGDACWRALAGLSHRKATPPRACTVCGEALTRRENEPPGRFNKRLTCGQACLNHLVGAWSRAIIPEKACPICGVFFGRGPGECSGVYRRRKTCGKECARQLQAHSQYHSEGRQDPYPVEFDRLRYTIKQRDGYRCRNCGQTAGKLSAHHIDHDKTNSAHTNLITLCAACHGQAHSKDKDLWIERLRGILAATS